MSIERIVIGIDGSDSAEKAYEQALELAQATGASLEIVSAYEQMSAAKLERLKSEIPDPDFAHLVSPGAQSERVVEQAATKATKAGVKSKTWVQPGDPASVLIDVAAETGADLIVVGNRGMTGAGRFLLGSVPNKVSHHAPCGVLIARTT